MSKERLLPYSDPKRNGDESSGCISFSSLRHRLKRLWNDSRDFSKKVLETGRNDPRKAIYAIKMGSALALVSFCIFWKQPNFSYVSEHSIWAILTVIVMFEFSIGATFIKGFNRGLGTFCAGMLAFLFAELSVLSGPWEKVVIVISFFIIGSFASYLRLFPTMAPYDYGYRVFVLTYCILMVAGNKTRDYRVAIFTRLVLFTVGAVICFIINIFIYPIWSGDDLHRLVVNNLNELAASLEGCVNGYLRYDNYERPAPTRFMAQPFNDQLYLGYKSVIESANKEQTLLGFAVWEPPHGRYRKLRYPWKTYVKVSVAVRHCAYTVMALHGCILSEIQAPPEKRQILRRQLEEVSTEGSKVLRELGNKIQKMEKLGRLNNILKQVQKAGEQLQKKIDQRSFLLVNTQSWEHGNHTKDLQMGYKSSRETAIHAQSSPLIVGPRLPDRDLAKENLRKYVPWPSWISFEGDDLIKEDEIKTYQSASALSLTTFASLLIEFVARLQNVVDCFEELSEKAEFKDPNSNIVLRKSVGFWTRLFR